MATHWQPIPIFFPENPMERGAWQVMVHRVANSWTRLKLFSMHTCTVYIYICVCRHTHMRAHTHAHRDMLC